MTTGSSLHRASQGKRGVTLVELVISMSIFMVVLLGIYLIFDAHFRIFASGESRADVQFNARYAMAQMARQIRMAGYFPENFATPPAVPASTNGLQVATDTALAIRGDADGSGTSNVWLYCVPNGTTNLIRVKAAVGTPAAYTCAGGQILGRGITSLTFAYFGVNNTPIAPAPLDGENVGAVPAFGSTAQRALVRRVVITLTAMEMVPGQQDQTYTLTSDLRLRNLNGN